MEVDGLVDGSPQVVVEIDGPTHYTINTFSGIGFQQMGATLFRNQLLEGLGYKVI